jgi:acyl carrier protein
MNSISFIYWILKIEEEFNIEIESLAYSELKTLDDLINLIISKLD